MPQIFVHDVRHRHAQRGGEILRRHGLLPLFILQQFDQAIRQTLRVSRWVKLDREIFTLRHLPEVRKVCRHDRHAIRAGQVGNTTASRGRRVRHDCHARTLKQVRQSIFRNVPQKLNSTPVCAELAHQVGISRGLGMVPAGDNEPGVRNLVGDQVESFNHEFQALVRSPFSESENALDRAAARKIGELRAARENAVRAQMHIVAAVFIVQNFAIAGHQHRNGIRQQ